MAASAPAIAPALVAAGGLLGRDPQCADIGRLPATADACAFAREFCLSDALVPYLPLYYCLARPAGRLAAAAAAAAVLTLMIALFRALGATAEVYLGPTMTGAALALRMPPRLAGATLLALVNGAPDIAASAAAVRGGHVDLAFGALAGAGLFVGCIVGGAVVRTAGGAPARGALVRDACAYGLAVAAAAAVLKSGSAGAGKAAVLLVLYAIYVAAVAGADAVAASARRAAGEGADDPLLPGRPPVADLPPALAPRALGGGRAHRGDGLELSLSDMGGRLTALLQSTRSEQLEHGAGSAVSAELQPRPATANGAYAAPQPFGSEAGVSDIDNDGQDDEEAGGRGRPGGGGDGGGTGAIAGGSSGGPGGGDGAGSRRAPAPAPRLTSPFMDGSPGPPPTLAVRALDAAVRASAAADAIGAVLDKPFALALAATVPVVADEPAGGRAWLPTALSLGPPAATAYLGGSVGAVAAAGCAGTLAGVAAATARFAVGVRLVERTPRSVRAIVYSACVAAGVAASVLWVGALAAELVGCLQFVGVVASLPPAVLGGTLLAWGNSIGDLATNVAVAKSGLPNMALTACYAGPATNLLLGLGGGLLAAAAARGAPLAVSLSPGGASATAYVALMVALVLGCAAVFGRRLPPASSWAFLAVYAAYTVTNLALAAAG